MSHLVVEDPTITRLPNIPRRRTQPIYTGAEPRRRPWARLLTPAAVGAELARQAAIGRDRNGEAHWEMETRHRLGVHAAGCLCSAGDMHARRGRPDGDGDIENLASRFPV